MVERDFLKHLAQREPLVLHGLWRLRQRAYLEAGVPDRDRHKPSPPRRTFWRELRFPGDGLLFAVLVGFFVTAAGLATIKLLWPSLGKAAGVALPFDVLAFVGALATWWLAHSRDRVTVKPVEPPDPDSTEPLLELQDLAERSALQLKQGYRAQLTLAVLVSAVLAGLIAWALVIVAMGYTRYGLLLGGSALLTSSLMGLNWHPFGRAREVRRLAAEADRAATNLGLQLASVDAIRDTDGRLRAKWRAVAQSLVALESPPR